MVIAVTKLSENYGNWLKKLDPQVEIKDLFVLSIDEAMLAVADASGILISGGCDIHPSRYGRGSETQMCRDIDEKRDILEQRVIEYAFLHKLPVFGICRGQQMLNVAFGGSLYTDIYTKPKTSITHSGDKDMNHTVSITADSRVALISGATHGTVNSSHHQAIDLLAPGFRPVAFSEDSIIEAIECDRQLHPFCIAVQWHPERMDFENPLSGSIGKAFMEAVRSFR
ncbi:MAG TPA: gamma-glutamyl-gamma-aminobutyrate hydrolase family protein [Bacteroidales bacterium]|nr:gamma-glutamyl-gamma-aminobutyrate hydrolase family protein [Bacteroidales bacterium]